MPPFIPRRLSPVIVGACRALHDTVQLPESGQPPHEDLVLAKVLSALARGLVEAVEATEPGAMDRLHTGQHVHR